MELRFKSKDKIATLYTANISAKGWLTWWPGQHSDWHRGFVIRVLWLGLVVRWGRVPRPHDPLWVKLLDR